MKLNLLSNDKALRLAQGTVLLNLTGIETYSEQDQQTVLSILNQLKVQTNKIEIRNIIQKKVAFTINQN
jgi:hypothetical protein